MTFASNEPASRPSPRADRCFVPLSEEASGRWFRSALTHQCKRRHRGVPLGADGAEAAISSQPLPSEPSARGDLGPLAASVAHSIMGARSVTRGCGPATTSEALVDGWRTAPREHDVRPNALERFDDGFDLHVDERATCIATDQTREQERGAALVASPRVRAAAPSACTSRTGGEHG